MKKIKRISVTMTFEVEIGNVEVPDEVHNELTEIANTSHELAEGSAIFPNAHGWLCSNINQDDAFNWKFFIDEME